MVRDYTESGGSGNPSGGGLAAGARFTSLHRGTTIAWRMARSVLSLIRCLQAFLQQCQGGSPPTITRSCLHETDHSHHQAFQA